MKLLLYCTKAKPYITQGNDGSVYPSCVISNGIQKWHLNGKIVAECDFEVEGIFGISRGTNQPDKYDFKWEDRILNGACLTNDQMNDYIPNYAIHIKNLHIFDKPRELEQLETCDYRTIKKAPQNMMKCIVLKNDEHYDEYILISIRPEWLCKILNGEKTIEVRKRVLKEMLNNE